MPGAKVGCFRTERRGTRFAALHQGGSALRASERCPSISSFEQPDKLISPDLVKPHLPLAGSYSFSLCTQGIWQELTAAPFSSAFTGHVSSLVVPLFLSTHTY